MVSFVSLLILLTAIILIGIIVAAVSPVKFLLYLVLVVFMASAAILLLLIGCIPSLSAHIKIFIHRMVRWGFPFVLVVYALFFPERTTIQKIPLNPTYTCIIYEKTYDDFTGAGLYYEIRKGRALVVPLTHYDYAKKEEWMYQFSVVSSRNGKIIGIIDTSAFSLTLHKLIVLFDTRVEESWPRSRKKDWTTAYTYLQADHPDIPVPPEFSQ